MKLIILTTSTSHHNFCVRELAARFEVSLVIEELSSVKAPFDTFNEQEQLRDEYEWDLFFGGIKVSLEELAPTRGFESVDDPGVREAITSINPDVIIAFGCSKVSTGLISVAPSRFLNFHGGNPELYRGLDSHLWAIYHRDYSELVVTLHRLTERLDTGDIVDRRAIPIWKGMKYHQLRAENVKLCVQMATDALSRMSESGNLITTPQRSLGRYYSFMPRVLKDICIPRFEKYAASLATKISI